MGNLRQKYTDEEWQTMKKQFREYALEDYRIMSARFNKMSFIDKIRTIKKNTHILTLASDYNWWGVKVKNKEIQEQLEDLEENFNIENE